MDKAVIQESTVAQAERSPPPVQLELAVTGEAEFVICD